jgi:hypothetical protein
LRINDISPLLSFPKLEAITLCLTQDISVLPQFKKLQELVLYRANVREYTPIQLIDSLTGLAIYCCPFHDLSLIRRLKLKWFEIITEHALDLSPLNEISTLERLKIECRSCSLYPLTNLHQLISFKIWYLQVSNLDFVHDMPKLEYLEFYGAKVLCGQVHQIAVMYPALKIRGHIDCPHSPEFVMHMMSIGRRKCPSYLE